MTHKLGFPFFSSVICFLNFPSACESKIKLGLLLLFLHTHTHTHTHQQKRDYEAAAERADAQWKRATAVTQQVCVYIDGVLSI